MKNTCVLIAGGSVSPEFLRRELQELKEQYGNLYIVTADAGIKTCRSLAEVVDYAIGDFDSDTDQEKQQILSGNQAGQVLNPMKDDTDTEAAIQHLLSQKAQRVFLYGVTGTRLDHTLANISLLKRFTDYGVQAQIRDEHNRIYVIRNRVELHKKNMFGKYVSILPYAEKVEKVTLEGFLYSGDQITFRPGSSLGISNEMSSETASISYEGDGCLIIMETKD